MKHKLISITLIVTLMMSMMFVLTGCGEDSEPAVPAEYGSYGADFARTFATEYPYRKAFSEQEFMAGESIRREFEDLGFDVDIQTFSSIYGSSSQNYVVKIEGKGFVIPDEENPETYEETRRSIVIGAHYDSPLGPTDVSFDSTYDGISDNASGVGCLVTIASQIGNYDLPFDVYIVAFGAGTSDFAGARYFYDSLSAEEKASIDVMYCIDSIYAGDKIYASAGWNSLNLSQKYEMRRKLYQAFDVAYDNMLASRYSFDLRYNESGIMMDVNSDGSMDVYREVSLNKSDYVVFDQANIPIVFFDSFDYFFDSVEDMKETKNLTLQDFGGMIRGTGLDSSEVLDAVYLTEESDLLEIRINNVSFVILESMTKGSDVAMTREQYDLYLEELASQTIESETEVEG